MRRLLLAVVMLLIKGRRAAGAVASLLVGGGHSSRHFRRHCGLKSPSDCSQYGRGVMAATPAAGVHPPFLVIVYAAVLPSQFAT
jgi:hypothetical protein